MNVGVISGRIYDAQDPEKAGIPNVVLVTNGATAVTDENGRFIFPALPPGVYPTRVNTSTIGLDRVPQITQPMLVDVKGGESASLDIGIIDAARVVGTVMVYPRNGNGNGNGYVNGNGNGNGSTVHDGENSFVVGDPRNGNGNGNGNGRLRGNGNTVHDGGNSYVVGDPRNGNGNGNGNGRLRGNGNTVHDGEGSYVVGDPRNGNGNGNGNGYWNGNRRNGPNSVEEIPVEPWGVRNILVELSNGDEVIRTLTNYKGEFTFSGVRPGHWKLKAYDHNLPDYHYLEAGEMDLELQPSATAHVLLRVLPRLRPVKIIDEGKIRSDAPNGR
jgi:hypothetical protein